MKIIAISDLHGNLPIIPPCNLLLIAGDICPVYDHSLQFQQYWLDTTFRRWLKELPVKHIVGIAGNHDLIFQEKPHWVPKLPWIYLQDSGTEIEGLKIWGTPWQKRFHDWAFNLDEEELVKKWDMIPLDTDILVLHGPPYGYGDEAPRIIKDENEQEWPGFEHIGSPSLLSRLKLIKPKLVVFGHNHDGFGKWEEDGMVLANVSYLNNQYQPTHSIQTFEIGKIYDRQ